MTEVGPPVRRGAGRPTREQAEARHAELLDTALDLFLEHGYEQATVEAIAARVNMTKRTIYALYPDKASLFLAAVRRAIDRQAVPRAVLDGLDSGDLTATLAAIARLRIDQVMTSDGLRLQRIINTESYRFPEIFVTSYEVSTGPVVDFVVEMLERAAAAGEIAPVDCDQAARAFLSMAVGGQVRAIVAGRPPTRRQLEQRVRFAVRLLLDGLRPR
ncbi:TetR/AcrR family transcriptional regulator [Nocardia fluminea]|uniref:TetR/AcrR family transcriptional regulator n=1 Tax=Nocardia fluminea TaxID=134984 RepID=UPI0033E0B110